MNRPILPFPPSIPPDQQLSFQYPEPDPPPPPPSKPTYAKRGKITIVACLPCRRRKTKCDGKRPSCSQCLGRDGVCQYDMTDDHRRLTFLRDNIEQLEAERSALESLLSVIQRGTEHDVTEVLRTLRSSNDLHAVARQAYSGLLPLKSRDEPSSVTSDTSRTDTPPSPPYLTPPEQCQSLIRLIISAPLTELDEIVRRLRLGEDESSILASAKAGTLLQPLSARDNKSTPSMETDFSSREQTFGLIKASQSGVSQDIQPDADVHTQPINQPWTFVTDDSEFIEHLLSLYFTWQHPFFQNFSEDLFRADMASGQTKYCSGLLVNAICAAGCLLSSRSMVRREPDKLRTTGLDFFDEAIKLLNQDPTSSLTSTAALSILSRFEGNHGRLSSLWHLSGRSSRMALDLNLHLRRDKSETEQVRPNEDLDESARNHLFWGCFVSDQVSSFTLGRLPMIPTNSITVDLPPLDPNRDREAWTALEVDGTKPSIKSTMFRQLVGLSKIVNSTLQMFFAPSKTMSGSLLLEEYKKYLRWYKKLAPAVASLQNATPHVLSLHMYYHAAVLLLFRPFLKAELTDSEISPRDVCRHSANAISDLFEQHRKLYGLHGISAFQMHCLLTACTIHIIKLPSISATTYLAFACNSFQDLIQQNEWATSSLDVIRGLVHKWQIVLPMEVELALNRNQEESGPNSAFGSLDPQARTYRPEKRPQSRTPASHVMPKRQRLAPRETRDQSTSYLFSPFPHQPGPLLGPIHTSTSGDVEWNDELNRVSQGFDGLNFSGDDGFDPFMGYQGD